MGNWKIIYESENGKITVFKGEDGVISVDDEDTSVYLTAEQANAVATAIYTAVFPHLADAARQAETGQL